MIHVQVRTKLIERDPTPYDRFLSSKSLRRRPAIMREMRELIKYIINSLEYKAIIERLISFNEGWSDGFFECVASQSNVDAFYVL